MKSCPYCGYSNQDSADQCRKCEAILITRPGHATVYKPKMVGPVRAAMLRHKALSFIVLGLLMKVYWGGYGPWPVYDVDPIPELRSWLEPLFLYGGAAGYVIGWALNWV